jgi:hypothetical protein
MKKTLEFLIKVVDDELIVAERKLQLNANT